ncbi:peptidase M24 [Salinibacter sp. 10B]|uniref:M23 family metallopeptidase n=1 Tax=Salinibacter sp. 10B TaxID=1923971 RepID=UPI000CF3F70B|nr:peptidoglycan DD-metalloendopeptidase family protein [Salinibacter sp. 10B]PQJ34176.1 peptidase M24 [Salinibacter sp. 10B]
MRIARLVAAGVLFLLLSGRIGAVGATPPDDRSTPSAAERTKTHFGISAEKYTVDKARVSQHQTFWDLLEPYGVSQKRAVRLARAARPEFNVRSIEAGQSYRVYVNPWLQQPQYLVYRIDPVRYAVFNIQRPSRSHLDRRTVEREWTVVRGTIQSSLYETLIANEAHPKLALRLSEVFAWQIDFFRIREGDAFRVLYEKRVVDGTQVAPGKILAAYFSHQNEPYYGFRFANGKGPKYFDRQGQSLQRKLLKAPLRYTRISSGYSQSRYHPVLKRRRPHLGTDYAAPTGTPVHAVGSGNVVKAGHYGNNGNYVKIRHNGTYTSGYLHLSEIAVEVGTEVQQGETIGYVGSTGLSTGPHLDYRLWKRGKAVDPYELELPPSRPIRPQRRDAFDRLVQDRLERLFPLRAFGPAAIRS